MEAKQNTDKEIWRLRANIDWLRTENAKLREEIRRLQNGIEDLVIEKMKRGDV